MVCQCDAAERHGGRARAFAALSSDAGKRVRARGMKLFGGEIGRSSRLSDRPFMDAGAAGASHPLIVSVPR